MRYSQSWGRGEKTLHYSHLIECKQWFHNFGVGAISLKSAKTRFRHTKKNAPFPGRLTLGDIPLPSAALASAEQFLNQRLILTGRHFLKLSQRTTVGRAHRICRCQSKFSTLAEILRNALQRHLLNQHFLENPVVRITEIATTVFDHRPKTRI